MNLPLTRRAAGEASPIVRHQATVGSRRFVVLASSEAYGPAGGHARMFGLSVITIEDLGAALGPLAEGIALSQVLPPPGSHSSLLAAEFRRALAAYEPAMPPSYHALEGYLEARVLVEGLRRTGSDSTRARLVAALESFGTHDFGGVLVRYGETDRTGSIYCDLIMLAANGRTVS